MIDYMNWFSNVESILPDLPGINPLSDNLTLLSVEHRLYENLDYSNILSDFAKEKEKKFYGVNVSFANCESFIFLLIRTSPVDL